MTSEERRAWLDGLKAETVVAICSGRDVVRLAAIDKVTPTQIVIGSNRYSRAKDGQRIGESYSYYGRDRLHPVTDEIQEKLDRSKFNSVFYDHRKLRDNLPIATIRKLLAVLAEAEGEQGKENT